MSCNMTQSVRVYCGNGLFQLLREGEGGEERGRGKGRRERSKRRGEEKRRRKREGD